MNAEATEADDERSWLQTVSSGPDTTSNGRPDLTASKGEGSDHPRSTAAGTRARRPRARTRVLLSVALAASFAGGLLAAGIGSGAAAAVTLANNPTTLLSTSALEATSIAADVDPAIVDVTTTLADGQGSAAGTGMVLTSSGYVLTNNHVVEDAVGIKVTIEGKGTHTAAVVGTDVAKDIAVLKVNGAVGLRTVRFASGASSVGTEVVAIGNALGKGGMPSTSEGTIVALRETITAENNDSSSETLHDLLETDAALQPGDSGGPLLNASGAVLAMDTAAASSVAYSSSGYGYAIPDATIVPIVDDILAGKATNGIIIGKSAYLGVEAATSGTVLLGGLSAPTALSGVTVERVVSGSPAAAAGLVAGDEITAFDGTAVTSASQLRDLILAKRPDDRVTISLAAAGRGTLTVTLASGPVA